MINFPSGILPMIFLLRHYAASFKIAGDIRKYFNGHLYFVHAEPGVIFTIEIVMNITADVEGVSLTSCHSIALTCQALIINSASVAVRYPLLNSFSGMDAPSSIYPCIE
ncbi:hypothetical protein [Enterobacter soli]|uniref:hypothetical protein n=1 Tax=Enterobacter soli TaxID=885040 RepID=UPI00214853CD|nr:hypothetical protein [Enterobacter soli]